jgi:transcriptional regulator with XRE-family HTH domain
MAEDIKKEIQEENLVKKTCRELGITQKELAEMLKVSQNTISNWTKGEIETINRILLESLLYKSKFEQLQSILNFSIKR